tara:strand:+ start:162 stop:431 length:270 start_codon:yes stop_codon:yes gene_type:complete
MASPMIEPQQEEAKLEALKARVERALRRHQGLHIDSREAHMLQSLLQAYRLSQACSKCFPPDPISRYLAAFERAELKMVQAHPRGPGNA